MERKRQILTIPNILSMVRILLIPIIVWLYVSEENYIWAGCLLLISGTTDVVDGFIARKFNMISELGKVLDPIADKLTQGIVLICLLKRFPLMWLPFGMMVLKETFMSVSGVQVIRSTGKVISADWHGKAATVLLYVTMLVHLFWGDIPQTQSALFIGATMVMIAISFFLYGRDNVLALKKARQERKKQTATHA